MEVMDFMLNPKERAQKYWMGFLYKTMIECEKEFKWLSFEVKGKLLEGKGTLDLNSRKYHFKKIQFLHVRASLHSIWLIDANRSFLLRPETSSSFLHKTRNSPTGKQEYPDLYTCLAATLMAVN